MSEHHIRIALNVKNLGNTSTPSDAWVARALDALDFAPACARRLFDLAEVVVSPAEADRLLQWAKNVPGWSEDFLTISDVGSAVFVRI